MAFSLKSERGPLLDGGGAPRAAIRASGGAGCARFHRGSSRRLHSGRGGRSACFPGDERD